MTDPRPFQRDENPAGAHLPLEPLPGHTSRGRLERVLRRGGRFVSVNGSARLEAGDLDALKALAETGAVTPVIDRQYALEQIAEAHRYVEAGRKKGNVVVNVSHGDAPENSADAKPQEQERDRSGKHQHADDERESQQARSRDVERATVSLRADRVGGVGHGLA